MNKHTIDLLDYTDIATLRDGIYARLDHLSRAVSNAG